MSRLWPLIRRMRAAAPRPFAIAAILTALVPLAGMALLGLSGWFIAASAIAGLAGLGLTFDFLRPSGGIRMLTMARSASRYGERLVGHDATLRALETLRLQLFAAMARLPLPVLGRLHSAHALNRLTSDIEAVEGLLIRLVFPTIAMGLVLIAGGGMLWALCGWGVALAVIGVNLLAILVLLRLAGPGQRRDAQRQEAALQAIRARTAETMALRADLLIEGRLPRHLHAIEDAITRTDTARAALDQSERRASLATALGPALAAGAAMLAGRDLSAPLLLMSVLIALAMGEALRLMWRGWAERGRITLAARRLTLPEMPQPAAITAPTPLPGPLIELRQLTITRPGGDQPLFAPLDLRLMPGDSIGLQAPSGAGKSTLLLTMAGVLPAAQGQILIAGQRLPLWPEADLRRQMVLVPQRPVLIGGTLAENLALAAPAASRAAMLTALDHVALTPLLAAREGLETRLGAHGAGLSGGETRRLALARAILCQPRILLLDEPTEGLDPEIAKKVLAGLRAALPDCALILASHRETDLQGLRQIVHPVSNPGARVKS